MADPYISEVKYQGGAASDFTEVVLDEGADPSGIQIVVYHPNGTVRSTSDLGSVVDTIAGHDIYVVGSGIHRNGAVALVEDGVVLQFVSFSRVVDATNGPAAGTSSTQIGTTPNNNSSLVSEDGVNYTVQSPPDAGTIPCFLVGTLIETDQGQTPIETLKVGSLVVTADHGTQPIRWIGSTTPDSKALPHYAAAPICFPAHCFGPGHPFQDLYVSQNHRILVSGYQCDLMFAQTEVLVAAKFISADFAYRCPEITRPEYFHLMFDTHEIVSSNGLKTESFHPGLDALDAFEVASRDEILALFPELDGENLLSGNTARLALKAYEAQALMA